MHFFVYTKTGSVSGLTDSCIRIHLDLQSTLLLVKKTLESCEKGPGGGGSLLCKKFTEERSFMHGVITVLCLSTG